MTSINTPAFENALTESAYTPAAAVKGNLLERIGVYLDSGGGVLGVEVLQLLRDVDAFLRRETKEPLSVPGGLQDTLQKINDRLEKIERKRAQVQQAQQVDTYAKAAERGRHGAPTTVNGFHPPRGDEEIKEARRAKEVTVRIEDPEETEKIRQKSIKDILQKAQEAGAPITGARRLPNGNVRSTTKSQRIRNTLQEKQKWTKVVAASAKIQKQTYTVIVHAMKVRQIDAANQKLIISQISKANEYFHRGLEIVRVAWPKKAWDGEKTWSSLYIEVTTAQMANRLITEGLIDGSEVKECERFCNGCQVRQCFNCQQYGHIAAKCRERTRCGHCAGWHRSGDCSTASDKKLHRCATCGVQGHEAWAPTCEVKMAEKRRAHGAYTARPKFFLLPSRESSPAPVETVASVEVDEAHESAMDLREDSISEKEKTTGAGQGATNGAVAQLLMEAAAQTTTKAPSSGSPRSPRTIGEKRRSRSASPRASTPPRDRSRAAEEWKTTIMNPEDKTRKKAYARPATSAF